MGIFEKRLFLDNTVAMASSKENKLIGAHEYCEVRLIRLKMFQVEA